jgi:hypothetical protein
VDGGGGLRKAFGPPGHVLLLREAVELLVSFLSRFARSPDVSSDLSSSLASHFDPFLLPMDPSLAVRTSLQPISASLLGRVRELMSSPEWAEYRSHCNSSARLDEHVKQRQVAFSARSTQEWATRPREQAEDEMMETRDETRKLLDWSRQLTVLEERMGPWLLETQRLTVALGRALRGEVEEEVESKGSVEVKPPLPPIVEDVKSIERLPTFA